MLKTGSSEPLIATPVAADPPARLPGIIHRLMANRLLTGSALFFVSTTVVNAGNYLFNLILGRWLGPAVFADVSIVITLFLLLTFITAGFQQTAAKFAAVYSADGDELRLQALRRWLNRRSWLIGLLCCIIIGGGASVWQAFFHTASPWIFVIFAISLPFYFVQGIDRGLLQGQMRFGSLAVSYQVEMWVRLLVGLTLVAVGWAAEGAVVGLSLSIGATWLVADYALRPRRQRSGGQRSHPEGTRGPHESSQTKMFLGRPRNAGVTRNFGVKETSSTRATLPAADRRAILHFALPVLIVETSLILINNSDVLIVKRFFESTAAGHYAALALIGRIVFFGTWSVVITMFPLVAQKAQRAEPHRHLLWVALAMVLGVSAGIIGATALFPRLIVQLLFGVEYLAIAPMLWLYAVATALFALANVLINYHLALGHRLGTVLALAAGLAQVILLSLFHTTLQQVVVIQIYLMSGLLVGLLLWDQSVKRKT